jgi:hypothetical protein
MVFLRRGRGRRRRRAIGRDVLDGPVVLLVFVIVRHGGRAEPMACSRPHMAARLVNVARSRHPVAHNRTNQPSRAHSKGLLRLPNQPGGEFAELGNGFELRERMDAIYSPPARTSPEAAMAGSRSTLPTRREAPESAGPRAGSGAWPASPLSAAATAFRLLTIPPAPLAFDCRPITGLPDTVVPLDELRRLLIHDGTPRPTRDLVWRELVIRAQRDGPARVVAAVGLALPGLRRRAGRLAIGWHGDTADLDAELLTSFLERLATIDIDAANICGRLIDAGAPSVEPAPAPRTTTPSGCRKPGARRRRAPGTTPTGC